MKRLIAVLVLALFVPVMIVASQAAKSPAQKAPGAGKAPAAKKAPSAAQQLQPKTVTTPSGLKYVDIKEGTGPEPKPGQTVTVKYVGRFESGKIFDQSPATGFSFKLGAGEVIKGWDEGVGTMKVGGERKLIVPPNLAYGKQGYPGVIPPDSTLVFNVTLLKVK